MTSVGYCPFLSQRMAAALLNTITSSRQNSFGVLIQAIYSIEPFPVMRGNLDARHCRDTTRNILRLYLVWCVCICHRRTPPDRSRHTIAPSVAPECRY
jgi:hypothetical protein